MVGLTNFCVSLTDDPEVIKKEIYRRINVLQKMKFNNDKDGKRSAARRKQKKIKSLQKLIEILNRGGNVEMSELTPVKDVSPLKEQMKVYFRYAIPPCAFGHFKLLLKLFRLFICQYCFKH